MSRRPRPCRKCAWGQPHPFRHWHVRCPMCRKFRIFRGPSCAHCHAWAKVIFAEVIEEIRREEDH